MSILTDELLDSIRSLIGVTEEDVPDATIRDLLIGGAVERNVRDLVGDPAYEDRPESEQVRMQGAVAYLTAARLLGTRAQREASGAEESEKFSDQYTVTRKSKLSITSWQSDLEEQAMEALEPLLKAVPRMTMFTTASGRRGA